MPKPSGMVLKSPQLVISIKLITENYNNAPKSADRPKSTTVFHINRSRQTYHLATSVLVDSYMVHQQRHMPSGGKPITNLPS